MKLYSYWRSSASYRVRIALNLKKLAADIVPVNLLKSEQKGDEYQKLNPQGRVPLLIDGEHKIAQSLAIIEYLEEKYPAPALFPATLPARAHARSLALSIACDISPMGNLGPMKYLTEHFSATHEQKDEWIRHWVKMGFAGLERELAESDFTGSFCHGAIPGLVDCFLVPQVYNARRFGADMKAFPTIERIDTACAKHPAFVKAHPSNQPDAA